MKILKNMLCAALISILAVSACACAQKKEMLSQTRFMLDTFVTIRLYPEDEELFSQCFELAAELENILSAHKENSETARLNREGRLALSEDASAVLRAGIYYGELSDGLFDISIYPVSSLWSFEGTEEALPDPARLEQALKLVDYSRIKLVENTAVLEEGMQIDAGGIAKGYIADKLAEFLREKGVKSGIIDLGGNIYALGDKQGEEYTVGIAHPNNSGELAGYLKLKDMSAVTSGIYQRYMTFEGEKYHHILNPETGYPENNRLASATVITKSSMDGDALSTICMLLGEHKALELINSLENVWAVLVLRDGGILLSEGAQDFFSQNP